MRDSRAWKVAWPLLLCAASAGMTFACVRMSDSNREKQMGKVTIEHVYVETEKPFAEVAAALEARMGKFDPAVYEQLRSGADPEAVRALLEGMAGPSGSGRPATSSTAPTSRPAARACSPLSGASSRRSSTSPG